MAGFLSRGGPKFLFALIVVFGISGWLLTARNIHRIKGRTGGLYRANPKSALSGKYAPPCLFAITPTLPRRGSSGVLNQTITDFESAFDSQPFLCGHLTVVNVRPGQHDEFNELKASYDGDDFFDFHERESNLTKLDKPVRGKWRDTTPVDVQQNHDMIEVLWTAHLHVCRADRNPRGIFMLMEDDVSLCPNALYHLHYFLEKVASSSSVTGGGGGQGGGDEPEDADDLESPAYVTHLWSSLRVSFGLNGVLLRCSDVPALARYLTAHDKDGPVDYVLPEFWNKIDPEAQAHYVHSEPRYVYRYNLFEHRGHVSSFAGRKEHDYSGFPRVYHACYDTLRSLLHPSDMFDAHCANDDVAPCSDAKLPDAGAWLESETASMNDNIQHAIVHPLLLDPQYTSTRDLPIYYDQIDRSLEVKVGVSGESCDDVCGKAGLYCDLQYLHEISTCKTLQQYTKCPMCTITGSQTKGAPSVQIQNEDGMSMRMCEVPAILDLVDCSAIDSVSRVCACTDGKRSGLPARTAGQLSAAS